MNQKEIVDIIRNHRYQEYAAARIEQMIYQISDIPEFEELLANYKVDAADEEMEAKIREMDDPAELVNLMRKSISGRSREILKKRLLEKEPEVTPLILKRCLTNRQDLFIENAVRFFLSSEYNPSGWIMDYYETFESDYLRALLCMVLGHRSDADVADFLAKEAERLEKDYPEEGLDQGPMAGLEQMATRFYGIRLSKEKK